MRKVVVFLAAALLLGGLCTAGASDVLQAQSEALDLEGLEEAGKDYLEDVDLEAGISLDEGLDYILDTGSGQLFGVLRKALRSGMLLVVIVVLCGLAEGLYSGTGSAGQMTDVVPLVGALAITAVAVTDVHSLIGMGREAALMSDFTVMTSDNPRTEAPEAIIDDIEEAYLSAGGSKDAYVRICDRREAIEYAMRHAKKGDLIAVIGKGHEQYQEINGVRTHFSDQEEIRRIGEVLKDEAEGR